MALNESICDDKVFSKVFLGYSKTLFNYLYYQCGDNKLAEDITQEAFLKLWQNCASVNFSSVEGYIFKTAKNQLLNLYKRDKVKLKFLQFSKPKMVSEDPAFILEEKEFKESLESAISNLPEKQRIVFLMSRIDKKTYKEIAEILDISRQAVEKRMYNALDSLRLISKNIR